MRGGANIVGGIHSIKQAHDHFELFEFEHPNTKGAVIFRRYREKLNWIYRDLITHPMLTDEVREGLQREWASDCFDVPAIQEKVALLNPDQRSFIETIVDAMLKGEEVKVVDDPKAKGINENSTNDTAIKIVNRLVELGYVKDCTDTDDTTEFDIQDEIAKILNN